jgi:hypothetical protein
LSASNSNIQSPDTASSSSATNVLITPSVSRSASLISPPSESSEDDHHDQQATKSLSKSVKRKRSVEGRVKKEEWAEKLYKDMASWHQKMDDRMQAMESIERERVGVLKEMKDMMKVWVSSMTANQRERVNEP